MEVGRQVVEGGRAGAGVGRTVVHVLTVGVLEVEARKPAAGVQEGQQGAGSSHWLMYHPRLCSLPIVGRWVVLIIRSFGDSGERNQYQLG